MKIYTTKNSSSASDFTQEDDFECPGSSNAHSGGMVILADSLQEAKSLMGKNEGTLMEIPQDKGAIILECNGDC